eukprot:scaffold509_cov91-Isochrysis_galbana.AAC.1
MIHWCHTLAPVSLSTTTTRAAAAPLRLSPLWPSPPPPPPHRSNTLACGPAVPADFGDVGLGDGMGYAKGTR